MSNLFLRGSTFVTLNRFCPLRKPLRVVNHLLFLTDKTKLDGAPSKIKWKIHVFWYIAFWVLKVLLMKEYKIQLVWQFLYFLLFYIASEFTSADIIFNIYWKKIFVTNFYFLNGFTQIHHPLAKRNKSFLLMLPKYGKILVLYLSCSSMT